MHPRRGLSLVEILVALVVFAAGVLPVILGVSLAMRQARRGQAHARIAVALLSRMALLRQAALATRPPCAALAAGDSAGRVRESWEVSRQGEAAEVVVRGLVALPGRAVADSVRFRIRCA
jgi:prepilin-type N-terminal cleavage/methylation domain-containing protein